MSKTIEEQRDELQRQFDRKAAIIKALDEYRSHVHMLRARWKPNMVLPNPHHTLSDVINSTISVTRELIIIRCELERMTGAESEDRSIQWANQFCRSGSEALMADIDRILIQLGEPL